MSKMKVTLQILENTYPLMCEPHERDLLLEAAEQLNLSLADMRRDNPKVPLERLDKRLPAKSAWSIKSARN